MSQNEERKNPTADNEKLFANLSIITCIRSVEKLEFCRIRTFDLERKLFFYFHRNSWICGTADTSVKTRSSENTTTCLSFWVCRLYIISQFPFHVQRSIFWCSVVRFFRSFVHSIFRSSQTIFAVRTFCFFFFRSSVDVFAAFAYFDFAAHIFDGTAEDRIDIFRSTQPTKFVSRNT